jgi:hypothetical protein
MQQQKHLELEWQDAKQPDNINSFAVTQPALLISTLTPASELLQQLVTS